MEWNFLALGIPAGVLATRMDQLFAKTWSRLRFGKLGIVGAWAEYIPQSQGRRFSLGEIKYDRVRRRYAFDGTNYTDAGDPFCHWSTVSSFLDREAGQFHYIFATKQADSLQLLSYGYGVVNLVSRDGKATPQDGYYVYALSDGGVVSVSHTMVPIGTIPSARTDNALQVLNHIFPDRFTGIETDGGVDAVS